MFAVSSKSFGLFEMFVSTHKHVNIYRHIYMTESKQQ